MRDGLVYHDCYLTAAVKCAPPRDRPTREEFDSCSVYLDAELSLLRNLEAVLTLGALSFKAFVDHAVRAGSDAKGLKFRHGGSYDVGGMPALYAAYHPSPRNTNTGMLTQAMLVGVLRRIKRDLGPLGSR